MLQKLKANRIWLLLATLIVVLVLSMSNMIGAAVGGLVVYVAVLLYYVADNPKVSWLTLITTGLMVVTFGLRLVIPQYESLISLVMGLAILALLGFTFRQAHNTSK